MIALFRRSVPLHETTRYYPSGLDFGMIGPGGPVHGHGALFSAVPMRGISTAEDCRQQRTEDRDAKLYQK